MLNIIIPLLKSTHRPRTNQQHTFEWVECFLLVYDFAYGGSGFYPVRKTDSMPGEAQLKVITHHDVKSLLPTHNQDQLLPLHQTFASRVVPEGCSAAALWLLAPSLADGSGKPSGSSSWSTAATLPSCLPRAELNLVLQE